jgi:hypothetical protein
MNSLCQRGRLLNSILLSISDKRCCTPLQFVCCSANVQFVVYDYTSISSRRMMMNVDKVSITKETRSVLRWLVRRKDFTNVYCVLLGNI